MGIEHHKQTATRCPGTRKGPIHSSLTADEPQGMVRSVLRGLRPVCLCLGLLLCASLAQSALVSKEDLGIMMKLKAMYIKKFSDLGTWQAGKDCSTWLDVRCDADRVAGIYFMGTWLGGPFPSFVSGLTGLRLLYFDGNNFTGMFPVSLAKCTNLQVVRLSGNLLRGPLPASFGGLKSLYKFYVKENQYLTGTIPRTWAKLNLQEAYFDTNSFSGPFPTVVCKWSYLQRLRLGGNKWRGAIPNCITTLTNMVNLYLDGIGLTGRIPPGIGALTNMEIFVIGGNSITGPIPESIGNLQKLQTVFFSANQLTGPLPKSMGKLKAMQEWTMEFNHIDGTLPTEIGDMSNVQRILLDNNRLTGQIPASIGKLKQLTMLLLEGNQLHGLVPSNLPGDLTSLVQFNVADNWLHGFAPTGWASPQIQQINIRSNYFTGAPDFKRSNGQLICLNKEITTWIINSAKFNCMTKNATCGANYNELQRSKALCARYCRANGPNGACNGKGVCNWVNIPKLIARCTCFKGYRLTRNGLSCK